MASTSVYSPKNATGPVGMGGQEPLSGEQVLQGVMNPTANALNVAQVDSSGNPISPTNPLPVTLSAPASGATITNASPLTITLGGTAQTIFAARASREYLFVLNTSDTAMYVENDGTAATTASLLLPPNGGYYEPLTPGGALISLLCATTGKAFCAKQA